MTPCDDRCDYRWSIKTDSIIRIDVGRESEWKQHDAANKLNTDSLVESSQISLFYQSLDHTLKPININLRLEEREDPFPIVDTDN